MGNEILLDFMETCYRPKHPPCFTQLGNFFISLPAIGIWGKLGHRNNFQTNPHVANLVKCKAIDLYWGPVQEKVYAKNPIEQHSQFRWQHIIALKQFLTWFWIDLSQSFSQKSCKWEESHAGSCIDWTSFCFYLKIFLSNMLLKIIINFVADQPSITWFWKFVQISKFSVLTFLRSMACSISIQWKMCKEKYFAV